MNRGFRFGAWEVWFRKSGYRQKGPMVKDVPRTDKVGFGRLALQHKELSGLSAFGAHDGNGLRSSTSSVWQGVHKPEP